MNKPKNIIERFYSKVTVMQSGCHWWAGATDKKGYGRFMLSWFPGKLINAHVFAWEIYNKKEATGEIHHKCGVIQCVNPEHLENLDRLSHHRLHAKIRRGIR